LARDPSLSEQEQAVNNVIKIKTFLERATLLYDALLPARSELLAQARDFCRPEDVSPVRQLISTVIHDDVTFINSALDQRNQRTFAVKVRSWQVSFLTRLTSRKAGVNGLLDVVRQAYKEGTSDIHEYRQQLNRTAANSLLQNLI
jgi:DNA mismatch repair protein MSH4